MLTACSFVITLCLLCDEVLQHLRQRMRRLPALVAMDQRLVALQAECLPDPLNLADREVQVLRCFAVRVCF